MLTSKEIKAISKMKTYKEYLDLTLRDYKVIALALDYALLQVETSDIKVLNEDNLETQKSEIASLLRRVRRELDMDNDKEFWYKFDELKELFIK